MKRFLLKMAQWALAILRLFGVDAFVLMKQANTRKRLDAAIPKGQPLREDGLGLMLDLPYVTSLSQVGRDFIDKLAQTSIPFSVLDTNMPGSARTHVPAEESSRYRVFAERPYDQRKTIHFMTVESFSDRRLSVAATPFWEFESGMPEARPTIFRDVKHILAFSTFCETYFRKIAPKDVIVHRMRYPFTVGNWTIDRTAVREAYGIPSDAFAVFFNFDLRSSCDRKNPGGAMEAFAKAFPDDTKTILVFKISGFDENAQELGAIQQKAQDLAIADRLLIIPTYMTHDDVIRLTGCMDAYLSLHRGEGLGLGILESMSVNVPVVATQYGGNCDFTNAETAFPIPYRLIPAKTEYRIYRFVKEWAEPDVDAAATALRTIHDHPQEAKLKADRARAFIEDYYGLRHFEKKVRSLIENWDTDV